MQILSDMLSRLNCRSRRFLAISLAACVLCVIAYAAIPDTGGVIHGCYKRNSGTLRVIDDAVAQCDNSETPIQWNQTGPQGIPGPQGSPAPPRLLTVATETGTFGRMFDCGAPVRSVPFVKQSATSRLRITYHDDAYAALFGEPGHADPEIVTQILIDGAYPSPAQIYSRVSNTDRNAATLINFTIFGYADGIAAGPHTLTSHYEVSAFSVDCYRGNDYAIEIEEIAQ